MCADAAPPTKAVLKALLGDAAQHDVYDAHSRASVLRGVPPSLRDATLTLGAKRVDLPVPDGVRAFAVADLLSAPECDALVSSLEAHGFEQGNDIAAEYPPEYRNSSRLIVFDEAMAETLFRRLIRHLSDAELIGCKPMGWQADGVWKPVGLNECWLFSRYRQGQRFSPHFDGHYKNNFQHVSIYSVTLYLNDLPAAERGGHLVFYRGTRAEPHETMRWRPVRGSAVVFQHDVLHAGEEISLPTSTKYIARTSLMFARVTNFAAPTVDPRFMRMRQMFASFDAIRAAGDPVAFTRAYLEAQELQLEGGRTRWAVVEQPFPLDKHTVTHVFWQHLDLQSIVSLSACCKSWFLLFRSGALWSAIYRHVFGPRASAMVNPLAMPDEAVDYYGAMRGRCLVAKRLHPVVFHLSNQVWMRGRDVAVNGADRCRVEYQYDAWDCSITNWRALEECADYATYWWGGSGWVGPEGDACGSEATLHECWLSGKPSQRLETPLVPEAFPGYKTEGYATFFSDFVQSALCIVDVIWPHMWSFGRDWQWISNYARGSEYLTAMMQLAHVVRPMAIAVLEAGMAGLLALKRSSGRVACVSGHGVIVLYEYVDRVPVGIPVLLQVRTWDSLVEDELLLADVMKFAPDALMCDLTECDEVKEIANEPGEQLSTQLFARFVRESVAVSWKERMPALQYVSAVAMMAAAEDYGNSPFVLKAFTFVGAEAGNLFDVSCPLPESEALCAYNLWSDCSWNCPDMLKHREGNCPTLLAEGSCPVDPSVCPWMHVPRPPPRQKDQKKAVPKTEHKYFISVHTLLQ